MNWKRTGAAVLTGVLAAGASLGQLQAANSSHMIPYTANYDQTQYPQKTTNAVFTGETVTVDGKMDDAYLASEISRIENLRPSEGYEYEEGQETYGLMRTLWDGPVLYLFVEVHDTTPQRMTGSAAGPIGNPAVPQDMDSVVFGFDLYNDKVLYETDTIGIFTIGSNGELYYYRNKNIPSLGSPMADPIHPEYQNRIREYAVAELVGEDGVTATGYTVELAFQLEGLPLMNKTAIGVDVMISDAAAAGHKSGGADSHQAQQEPLRTADGEGNVSGNDGQEAEDAQAGDGGQDIKDDESGHDSQNGSVSGNEEWRREVSGNDLKPAMMAEEGAPAGPAGKVFWSHAQDSLYTEWNHEHPNALDWGIITLSGWNGSDTFAYSDWRLTNAIRYLDSIAFPKGVYTSESQSELDRARGQAQQVLALAQTQGPDKGAADAAADRLEAAIHNLRWADTRYPDPDELPDQMTLPNPYQFFGSGRMVKSNADWEERRDQILDMAQFYEYGYKPAAPDKMEISRIVHYKEGDKRTILLWGFWPMEVVVSCPTDVVTMAITVGDTTSSLEFTVYRPTQEQLQASGHSQGAVPVVLSYDGDSAVYRDAGFAVVEVPAGSGGDGRSNEYAWGTRTGTFYELYPYSRNGEGALREVSSEMAAAWSATRVIDALETLGKCGVEGAGSIAEAIDTEKLAVTGFSINGKYAFVAAVFDDRIDVCIPGAAGASGPSPWRYVYTGHEYDWTGTLFAPADSSLVSPYQVASGTEFMANSVRHNRVRETELFRQFLNPGNFYERLPGAYGYGTRLPYDQNDLVATLAPRAIILENTVNDYNDGCEADSLGLQVAKSVYRTLGYDADKLVKFNQRPVQSGEPHGSDDQQKARTAQYLNFYFYGTQMDQETDIWLNTDPFSLPVSAGRTQSPYDYYYGGFNTVTGGSGGAEGRDGWYYYSFPEETDRSALEAAISQAQVIKEQLDTFEDVGRQEFLSALEAAQSAYLNASSQEELDSALQALEAAMGGLEKKSQQEQKPDPEEDKQQGGGDSSQSWNQQDAAKKQPGSEMHMKSPKTGEAGLPGLMSLIGFVFLTAAAVLVKKADSK